MSDICTHCGKSGTVAITKCETLDFCPNCGVMDVSNQCAAAGDVASLIARIAELERLIMNWYIAPPDSGFSEETLALQDEAKRLVDSLPLPKFGG